jgi:septal ring factor EnvC (AmiA/AmiB activator)
MDCWEVLFTKDGHSSISLDNEYHKQLEHNDGTDWTDMKKVVWERYYLVESKTKQISTQLLTEFKAFASEMRAEHRQTMTELQNSENELAMSKKSYREVIDSIDATTQKINDMTDKIKKTRAKGSGNMETVFNTEYDLRFLFVELDNLEVRKTYAKDMNHKSIEAQYKFCV